VGGYGCEYGKALLDHGVSRPIQTYQGVSVLAHPPKQGHNRSSRLVLLADVAACLASTNYWMKITGASAAAFRKVPEYLRNGQGRWHLLAKEPTQMVQKYIQSARLCTG
jgi:hypothetical protein